MIDKLLYTYENSDKSNRLSHIIDDAQNTTGYEGGGQTIGYDANGNMTSIPDKATNIQYNYLNLSSVVNMLVGFPFDMEYLYRADGAKLKKKTTRIVTGIYTITITINNSDYLDGFQYNNKTSTTLGGGGPVDPPMETMMIAPQTRAMEMQAFSTDEVINSGPVGRLDVVKTPDLEFFPTAEGFYDYKKDQYIYQYKDQLGNARVSFGRNSAGVLEIVDNNDYYPFGMNHLKTGTAFFGAGSYKNYKYNGKELQETGMYDYGARFYMPDIGRWGVVDPLAEKMTRHSPYNYAFNNPLRFIDPDGRKPDDWVRLQSGQTIYDSRVTNQAEAEKAYGSGAEHRATGFTYTATTDGSTYQLGEHGFYLKNGSEVGLSEDYAQYAVDNSGETMQAGLALAAATIAVSGGPENPAGDLAALGELAIYGMQALAVKGHFEMTKIDQKPEGPNGHQYSLRATADGEYPVMSSGSSTPTGTTHLSSGQVWKYGETTSSTRYTPGELNQVGPGVRQVNEFSGTQRQIKMMEKAKIYNYFFQNGTLPPGNKIFR